MAYRNDLQALTLQLAEVERENEELRAENESLRAETQRVRDQAHEHRRKEGTRACSVCGGSLLAVALFAGRDHGSPLPLSLSTLRFVDPNGGFTRSAPVKSLVCSSCGFIHNFIDLSPTGGPGDPFGPGDIAH
jgi:hypothetical protein